MTVETPRFMIIDSQESYLKKTKRLLNAKWPGADVIVENLPYCSIFTMCIERPDILIVDYEFKNYRLLDEEALVNRLLHFKGLVIIYSSHDTIDISHCLKDKFGHIPKNFRIISKSNPLCLVKMIMDYEFKKNNDIKYPANVDSP